ncbi:unnamed protein product, partial [Prorocentrum cordatum]
VMGRPLLEFIPPEFRKEVNAVFDHACSGTASDNFEAPLSTKDGKQLDLLLNVACRLNAQGAVVGVIGVGQDITVLKEAMDESRRIADDLSRLIDSANAPILGIDTQGRVTEWNQKSAVISGWTKHDTVGRMASQEPLLALPAPPAAPSHCAGGRSGGRGAGGGRAGEGQALPRALLLAWLARLRHLHSACSDPLLKALALSAWGGGHRPGGPAPRPGELLAAFRESVQHVEGVTVARAAREVLSPLLAACQAARRRRGDPTELAICFVALCRALQVPARLVLAFQLGNPAAVAGASWPPAAARGGGGRGGSRRLSGRGIGGAGAAGGAAVDAPLDPTMAAELEQLTSMGFAGDAALSALLHNEGADDGERLARAIELLSSQAPPAGHECGAQGGRAQLRGRGAGPAAGGGEPGDLDAMTSMGFPRDSAAAALLQAGSEGGDSGARRQRATELLLGCAGPAGPAAGAPVEVDLTAAAPGASPGPSSCGLCGASGQAGTFCGDCGARLATPAGTASGSAAPALPAGPGLLEGAPDVEAEVAAWPEVYDLESRGWLSVDIVFAFAATHPVRSGCTGARPCSGSAPPTTGVWVQDDPQHCTFHDVTPRYSPAWWRVEQARGPRSLQRWWDAALEALSSQAPAWPALGSREDSRRGGHARLGPRRGGPGARRRVPAGAAHRGRRAHDQRGAEGAQEVRPGVGAEQVGGPGAGRAQRRRRRGPPLGASSCAATCADCARRCSGGGSGGRSARARRRSTDAEPHGAAAALRRVADRPAGGRLDLGPRHLHGARGRGQGRGRRRRRPAQAPAHEVGPRGRRGGGRPGRRRGGRRGRRGGVAAGVAAAHHAAPGRRAGALPRRPAGPAREAAAVAARVPPGQESGARRRGAAHLPLGAGPVGPVLPLRRGRARRPR